MGKFRTILQNRLINIVLGKYISAPSLHGIFLKFLILFQTSLKLSQND